MTAASKIYFCARANARALISGGGASSVRRRLAHAALLYDDVIVDAGIWEGRSGPSGTVEFRLPPGTFEGRAAFQTTSDRSRADGATFHFAVKPSGSDGPAHPLVRSKTTISWKATFDPLVLEVPRAYKWLHVGVFDLYPEDKRVVKKMASQDASDGVLDTYLPDEFSRKLVIGSANFALVLASRMDAAASFDSIHSQALAARLARGQATRVLGSGALAIAFPTAGQLRWQDIDELRRHRGMKNLRARLRDIESEALVLASSGRSFEKSVHDAYRYALEADIASLQPSLKKGAAAVLVGAGVSLLTGPLPMAIGVGAGAAVTVAEVAAARRRAGQSWIAAASRLRRPTGMASSNSQVSRG